MPNSSHLTPRSADTTGPPQGNKHSILLQGEEAFPFKLPACEDQESVLDRMDESESPLACTPQDRQTALHWRTQLIGTPPNHGNADSGASPNLGENRTTNRSNLMFRESEYKSVDGTARKRKNSEKSSTISDSSQKRKKVKDITRETVDDSSVKTTSEKAIDPGSLGCVIADLLQYGRSAYVSLHVCTCTDTHITYCMHMYRHTHYILCERM